MVAVLSLLLSSSLESQWGPFSPYDPYFHYYSARYLPDYDYVHLIAQCRQESGPDFSAHALSPAGAVGVCQFMKPTWFDAQIALGFVGSRTNPRLNIKSAAWYMRKMLFVWRGRGRSLLERLPLAQSAYNCGTGCVLRAQRKANEARNWEDIAPFLPQEARDYPIHIGRHYRRMRPNVGND
jgi:soluble lytic murein transglycosylase-like protein